MAERDSASSSSSLSAAMADFTAPPSLKFIMSNLKTIVSTVLAADNYSIWRVQVFKLFSANGFDGYLTGKIRSPDPNNTAEHRLWCIVDQNLVAALLSTISPAVLPYVIHLPTSHEIWETLERRLQSTNRSRVIQLKNELHHVKMNDLTMAQYLAQIKSIVDNISAAGAQIDTEDIILYTLNGLPPAYNPFKSSIRTSQLPISLETLYSFLCSEEINLLAEQTKDSVSVSDSVALYANRSNNYKGRSNKSYRGRGGPSRQPASQPPPAPTSQPPSGNRPICQICGKQGHTALNCWHRGNFQYAPPTSSNPRAFYTSPITPANPSPTDWILDSGASSHLTPDAMNLQQPVQYSGPESVSVANGSSTPIVHTGNGLLPLPDSNRLLGP